MTSVRFWPDFGKCGTWAILMSISWCKANKNIPPAVLAFMAKRANAKKTVKIARASHIVMTSHPAEVSNLIEDAAKTVK
jgi:pimeloyl-ACP methyl ester carboxylesterase